MISAWNQGAASTNNPGPISGIGTTVLGTNVLIVVSLGGVLRLGMTVTGIGIPDGTTITGGSGLIGGIGTYTLSAVTGTGFGTGAIVLTR